MKIIKLFLLSLALVFIGQVHAGAWDDLKPYEITENTPIISNPKDSTLVLEDPQGSLTVEEVLKRKDEFKPPSEMAPLDARHHYWILQKVSSKLAVDKNLRLNGSWQKINTHVISSDNAVFALKPGGFADGKYAFLSDIDPALTSSAKVPSREALFTLRSGDTLGLLSHTKAA